MAYFVLLWNPSSDKNTPSFLPDEPESNAAPSWSCGNSKGIIPGDHVILRRTGRGPKGVVGHGTVTRGSYEARWFGTDEPGWFVDVDWHERSDEPLMDRDDPELSAMDRFWQAQAGGTRISDDDGAIIIAKLRDNFERSFVPQTGQPISFEPQERRLFEEGRSMQRNVIVRGRSASVRDHCLSRHKPVCVSCGFDPIVCLGPEYRSILEVHHLDPIAASEPGRMTDPEIDCRPLCPTCHRIAHHGMRFGTCRSIDELKTLMATPR